MNQTETVTMRPDAEAFAINPNGNRHGRPIDGAVIHSVSPYQFSRSAGPRRTHCGREIGSDWTYIDRPTAQTRLDTETSLYPCGNCFWEQ